MVNLHKLRLAQGPGFPQLWNRLIDELQRGTIVSVTPPLMLSGDGSGQRLGMIKQTTTAAEDEVFYGLAAADFTTGATISLTPCDANGVATGEAAVTVTIPTSWGTVNLASATIGGTATAVTCKIASGTPLQYAFAADGTPYLIGDVPQQFQVDEKLTATGKQIKVAYIFGSNISTVSAWMPVYALGLVISGGALKLQFTPTGGSATDISSITLEESDTTPCDAPGS
jgi:hypothetical protein